MANLGGQQYFCQRHIYDEYGVCFECGKRKPMPKSSKERKAAHDARKRAAGFVPFQVWVTEKEKQHLIKELARLRK